MMMDLLINIGCSFMGTLAFSILFNVPKRYYACCGLNGVCGWLVYLWTVDAFGVAVATFLGACVVVLISRILAVWMKCPISIFMVSGIFPLIPGASVYYTAYYLVTNNTIEAGIYGLNAVKIGFAIVIGIICIVSIPKKWFVLKYWRMRADRYEEEHHLKKEITIEMVEKASAKEAKEALEEAKEQ